jgi:hypothetical protein
MELSIKDGIGEPVTDANIVILNELGENLDKLHEVGPIQKFRFRIIPVTAGVEN